MKRTHGFQMVTALCLNLVLLWPLQAVQANTNNINSSVVSKSRSIESDSVIQDVVSLGQVKNVDFNGVVQDPIAHRQYVEQSKNALLADIQSDLEFVRDETNSLEEIRSHFRKKLSTNGYHRSKEMAGVVDFMTPVELDMIVENAALTEDSSVYDGAFEGYTVAFSQAEKAKSVKGVLIKEMKGKQKTELSKIATYSRADFVRDLEMGKETILSKDWESALLIIGVLLVVVAVVALAGATGTGTRTRCYDDSWLWVDSYSYEECDAYGCYLVACDVFQLYDSCDYPVSPTQLSEECY